MKTILLLVLVGFAFSITHKTALSPKTLAQAMDSSTTAADTADLTLTVTVSESSASITDAEAELAMA